MTGNKAPHQFILGILGGGQLGRMSAMAAAKLGIRTHIYAPDPQSCPAGQVSTFYTQAAYDDVDMLKTFAENVDFIGYEFENIPIKTIQYLQKLKPVYPRDNLLDIAQNRLKEKQFLNDAGIKTAKWAGAKSVEELIEITQLIDFKHCIIKTIRFGYDGKGQILQLDNKDSENNWQILGDSEVIIESIVDFQYEISVIIARNHTGNIVSFPPVLNNHKNHILSQTIFPPPLAPDIRNGAITIAERLAEAVDLVGVMALEMFVTRDNEIIANEIAPRTHNSGHWTMDACNLSQFDLHVRAVCGLPLPRPIPLYAAEMINLIGEDVYDIAAYLKMEKAHVHLYGKEDVKPGRKMGHITILKEPIQDIN